MKFLSQARKFLQNLAAEPVSKAQYFNVICASGHRVRGERTEGYQALRCPACGDGVFVLPRSPLPEPIAPARPQTTTAAGGGGGGWVPEGPVELTDAPEVSVEVGDDDAAPNGAEIIWEDVADEYMKPPASSHTDREGGAGEIDEERPGSPARKSAAHSRGGQPPEQGVPARSRAKHRGQRGQPGGRGQTASDAAAQREAVPRAGRRAERTRVPVHRRSPEDMLATAVEPRPVSRRRAIPMLILIVVPVVVVLTVAWRLRQNRLQEYPLIAQEGLEQGIPALDEGNFDKAYHLLSKAKTAVNALGGAVEEAEAIRTAADEAEVFNYLCSHTLEQLLAEAGRTPPDDWPKRFDAIYKGLYFVFDTRIWAVPVAGKSSAYELEYWVLPDGETSSFKRGGLAEPDRIGRIDLTGFQLFELARPQVGQRVTFGAKLAGFERDKNTDQWLIKIEPKSGVYITHTKALEALGWPSISEPDGQPEGQP